MKTSQLFLINEPEWEGMLALDRLKGKTLANNIDYRLSSKLAQNFADKNKKRSTSDFHEKQPKQNGRIKKNNL